MMELTTEERAILAHVVVDVDAYVINAVATVGEQAVTEKIAKYRQAYLDALAAEGENYQTRAERDAAEAAALTTAQEAAATQHNALRQQLLDLAQSSVGVSLSALTTAQRSALTAGLLYLAGGVTADMKVKPLSEWLT